MRAAIALAVAFCACGGASNDWPNDVVLTSPHFRYHARSGDVLCDDLLTQLEDNLTAVARLLDFDPAAVSIDYYKYRDPADLRANGPCPEGWGACAGGSTIHAPYAGKHYVGVQRGAGTLGVQDVSWLASQCTDARALRLGADIPSDYTLWLSIPAGAERWIGIDTTEPFTQYSNDAAHYCPACPAGASLDACLSPSRTSEIVPAGSYLMPVAARSGPRFHSVALQLYPAP